MAERALSAGLGALLAFGSIAAEARAEPAGRIEVYQQMGGPFGYPGMGATGDECTLYTSHGNVVLPLKQCTGCGTLGMCVCNAETCEGDPTRGVDFELTLDRSLDGADILSTSDVYPALRLERAP